MEQQVTLNVEISRNQRGIPTVGAATPYISPEGNVWSGAKQSDAWKWMSSGKDAWLVDSFYPIASAC